MEDPAAVVADQAWLAVVSLQQVRSAHLYCGSLVTERDLAGEAPLHGAPGKIGVAPALDWTGGRAHAWAVAWRRPSDHKDPVVGVVLEGYEYLPSDGSSQC